MPLVPGNLKTHNYWMNYKTGLMEEFRLYPPRDRVLDFVPQDTETQQRTEMELAQGWAVSRIMSRFYLRPIKED